MLSRLESITGLLMMILGILFCIFSRLIEQDWISVMTTVTGISWLASGMAVFGLSLSAGRIE